MTAEHGFASTGRSHPRCERTTTSLLGPVGHPSLNILREMRRLVLGKIPEKDPKGNKDCCIIGELTTLSVISEPLANAFRQVGIRGARFPGAGSTPLWNFFNANPGPIHAFSHIRSSFSSTDGYLYITRGRSPLVCVYPYHFRVPHHRMAYFCSC